MNFERAVDLGAVITFLLLAGAAEDPLIRFSCLVISFLVLMAALLGLSITTNTTTSKDEDTKPH